MKVGKEEEEGEGIVIIIISSHPPMWPLSTPRHPLAIVVHCLGKWEGREREGIVGCPRKVSLSLSLPPYMSLSFPTCCRCHGPWAIWPAEASPSSYGGGLVAHWLFPHLLLLSIIVCGRRARWASLRCHCHCPSPTPLHCCHCCCCCCCLSSTSLHHCQSSHEVGEGSTSMFGVNGKGHGGKAFARESSSLSIPHIFMSSASLSSGGCYSSTTGDYIQMDLVNFSLFILSYLIVSDFEPWGDSLQRTHLSHDLHHFTNTCLPYGEPCSIKLNLILNSSFLCCTWLCCHTHVYHRCSMLLFHSATAMWLHHVMNLQYTCPKQYW